VREYIVSKGIAASRIISQGYGETKPVATNDTDEGRQLNRRVEFKILKN
jgi:outer membrane protein OmpA-like peptidoglycan-associated protein